MCTTLQYLQPLSSCWSLRVAQMSPHKLREGGTARARKPTRRSQPSPQKPHSVWCCAAPRQHLTFHRVTEGCGANRRGLAGKIPPVLMSSDMPAVATPPAYKCTCSSKEPPCRTTSLCPLNFTSVLRCETSNHVPNRLLSSEVTARVVRRSRSLQTATSLGHIGGCCISFAKRAPNVSSPRLKIAFRVKHTHGRALTGVFR